MRKFEIAILRDMLVHREKGYSVGYILRRSVVYYLYVAVVSVWCFYGCFYGEDDSLRFYYTLGLGIFLGATVRDFGMIRRLKKRWPLTEEIVDWGKVEAIVNSEDGR